MVELIGTPFVDLIDRMRLEFRNQQSLFDLPIRKWHVPLGESSSIDHSVRFHDQVIGSPVGPASGPQTQMAQNLVLSWLAGARIMELKTVQVNDRLSISRPCIDAANVGYNVEWSQELEVDQSLGEYVQGAMLIQMLRHAPEVFGNPMGDTDTRGKSFETVFDMSIGYDLAGIESDKVVHFLRGMIDATASVDRLRNQIPRRLQALRELEYPTRLSHSVTLSTFHGCPAAEIERMCAFLLVELNVHVIVKMNPPMLGKDQLEFLLHDRMGYTEIRVNPSAYTSGLSFDESVAMSRRLRSLAQSRGLRFGAKFSNTLEVLNHRHVFDSDEKVMYLSGPPLHVITLTLAHRFREAMGADFPISFSAGVDQKNFANMVACGFVPITICTDLLKTGGYGRLPRYLVELTRVMEQVGATRISDYILDARGQREAAGNDSARAGHLNTEIIVQETQSDPRYGASRNRSTPKKVDSHLTLFDCLTCDKCVPVCPNDANFVYDTGKVELKYRDVVVTPDGSVRATGELQLFKLEQEQQIANFADYCNHCGNCDTFCPEYDGPYIKKPTFFGSRLALDQGSPHDGFFVQWNGDHRTLIGRINATPLLLEEIPDGEGGGFRFHDGTVSLRIDHRGHVETDLRVPPLGEEHVVEMGRYHALVTLLHAITGAERVHAVNAPELARNHPG